jgi:hypothetical protein
MPDADYDLISRDGSHLMNDAGYPLNEEEEPSQFQNNNIHHLQVQEKEVEDHGQEVNKLKK